MIKSRFSVLAGQGLHLGLVFLSEPNYFSQDPIPNKVAFCGNGE